MTSDDLIKLAAVAINEHQRAGRVMTEALLRHRARQQSARLKKEYEDAVRAFASADAQLQSVHTALLLQASLIEAEERGGRPVLRVVK